MGSENINSRIIHFFENIEKYYGCPTEITAGLYSKSEDFDINFTTWNLSEFILVRSAYRNNGARLMMEGEKMYHEISAKLIIDFKQPGRNTYEFVEQYSDTVFRITKIKFHSKY